MAQAMLHLNMVKKTWVVLGAPSSFSTDLGSTGRTLLLLRSNSPGPLRGPLALRAPLFGWTRWLRPLPAVLGHPRTVTRSLGGRLPPAWGASPCHDLFSSTTLPFANAALSREVIPFAEPGGPAPPCPPRPP